MCVVYAKCMNVICLFVYLLGDYMTQGDVPIYEDLQDFTALKRFMEDALEDYNNTPGVISMDLVLFRDAIEHGKYNP